MDVEKIYSKIITEIAHGARGLQRYSTDEVQELASILKESALNQNAEQLRKILCVIEHSMQTHREFSVPLLHALSQPFPVDITVFLLNCSRKHIIADRFKKGLRLEFDFLETLKKLLYSKEPEIVEWTLRTIEECGSQGVYFLQEFDKIKPPPWKWFNQHQRAVREIITLLERRWSQFEKR